MSEEVTRTRKKYNVSPEYFVQTWKEVHKSDGTIDDVATKLGMPKNAVVARYTNYTKTRKDGTPGVPLPKLKKKRSNKELNIAKLTELAEAEE